MSKDQLQTLSHGLRGIKYIHDVLRRPKAFNAVSRWKASEIRVFVLYIGLPLLINILSADDAGDLAVFAVIMRSMRDQWTGDRQQARAITLLIKQYVEHLHGKQQDGLLPSSMLTITTHTHTHMPDQCLRFGRMEWQENFLFESCLGYLKQFVKGPDGAASQIAIGFSCSFALQSLHKQQPISRGHFLINEVDKVYGSNVFNNQSIIELVSPIVEPYSRSSSDRSNAHRAVYFARLHKMFTTFHSFVYQRRGDQTCSYLVAYRQGSGLHYGYIMVYVLIDKQCFVSLLLSCPLASSLNRTFSIESRLSFNRLPLSTENAYPRPYRLILSFQPLTHRCDLYTLSVRKKLHLSRTRLSLLCVLFVICTFDVFLFVSITICVFHIFRVLTNTTEYSSCPSVWH
jgi:hypothetical protein